MDTNSNDGDMAGLFRRLAAGGFEVLGEIESRLRPMLRAFVRLRLKRHPELSAIYDEEEAFQSGFTQMWSSIVSGKSVPPDGIGSFLRMARTIIGRGIVARARAERAKKRDPAAARPVWATGTFYWLVPDSVNLLEIGVPSGEAKVIAQDTTKWLLSLLGPALRGVAEDRFVEGLSIAEIAANRGQPRRTIERMLHHVIRVIWYDAARELER